jgi:proteasome lid subunit RPN8/RPN11
MSLYLPQVTKDRTEDYIRKNDFKVEHGGFFLGKDRTLLIPRFYPNLSKTPDHEYVEEPHSHEYMLLDQRLFGMDLVVEFHTHPRHYISSIEDLKHARAHQNVNLNIMIGYNEKEDAFTWHAYDNTGFELKVININDDFPIFKELFSQSLRLTSLGDCFLTPSGDLLANNPIAKVVINVDAEAMQVYNYYIAKRWLRYAWSSTESKNRTQIAQDLGMTVPALVKVVTRLQQRGIKEVFLPKIRGR